MAKVIALDGYLRGMPPGRPPLAGPDRDEPYINDSQVWSKDYSKLENVVFGLLKIREVLNYHLYYEDVWPYLLLNLLDAAAMSTPDNRGELHEAAMHLRNYILQAVDAYNRKGMYACLIILDLIEKAPGFKARIQGDAEL
jgi:hypothetical protein